MKRKLIIALVIAIFLALTGLMLFSYLSNNINDTRTAWGYSSLANISILHNQKYLKQHGSYLGFCSEISVRLNLEESAWQGTEERSKDAYVCNMSDTAWAASVPRRNGGYFCVDSTRNPLAVTEPLKEQVSCKDLPLYPYSAD